MKHFRKMFLIGLIIIILIWSLNSFYFTSKKYYTVSGNGNPGLIIIALLLPLIIIFSYYLIEVIIKSKINWLVFLSFLIVSIFFDIKGYEAQKFKLISIREQMTLNNIPPELVTEITSGITYYTNTVYFNFVTLLMYLLTISTLGMSYKKIKEIKSSR